MARLVTREPLPMPPRVSIVVTRRDSWHLLDKTLDSVHAQTFDGFEVVIVTAGSSDQSDIERLTSAACLSTRVLDSGDCGRSRARNAGIRGTSGELISVLEPGDLLVPTFLERSVRFLDEHPEVSFASHWRRTIGTEPEDWTPDRSDLPALLATNTISRAALVRRSAIDAVGGFDESMRAGGEDWDLWITLVERGHPGAIISEVLCGQQPAAGATAEALPEHDIFERAYRQLLEKHADSVRQYLPEVLALREEQICRYADGIEALEREYTHSLVRELRRLPDDAAALEAKRAFLEENRAATRAAFDKRAPEAETTRAEAERFQTMTRELTQEVAALRSSMSWRVTAPLRALVDLLRGRSQ
jgi:glycosyltransferase involved in cell wall biosynthesis